VCFFLSGAQYNIWPLAWLAPAPLLAVAFESSARVTALTSFIAVFLGSAGVWEMQTAVLPIALVVGLHAVEALIATIVVLQVRRTVERIRHWICVFAFPAWAVALSYLFSRIAPDGTMGSPAYTQVDFLPLIQVASLVGLSGITFLVTLLPSGLALAWHHRRDPRRAIACVALPVVLLLPALTYGWMRLARPWNGRPVRVGLAATDETVRFFRAENPDDALPVVHGYARRVGDLAARGAEVVVLPEKFVGVTPAYLGEAQEILASAARMHRVSVIAGFNQIEPPGKRNRAYVFSPNGKLLLEYDKAFTLPLEGVYHRGTEPGLISTPDGLWGIAICKDMDFPRYLLRYAQAGVGIMFVPAWDFVADGRIHSRMAVMRGIEGGYAIARTAQEGLVTASDHLGRILAEGPTSGTPEVLVTAEVPLGPGRTLYGRTGDWFAWLNVLAAAAFWVTTSRRPTGRTTAARPG
jgi:apolipoprotein N-acyltransferase